MSSEDSKANESGEVLALSQAINYLAFNLYQELAKEKINVFFSPLSLSSALSTLLSGSSGDTVGEMKNVLGYDSANLSNEKVCHCFKLLHSALEKTPESFTLGCANVLLTQRNFAIKEEFKNLVNTSFQAKVMEVDFMQGSVELVNGWVRDKTKGMIDELLYSIGPFKVLIIFNAVYFKGQWMKQFEKNNTYKQMFYNKGRQSGIKIDMMHLKHDFRFAEEQSFKALDMPYTGKEISMLILLPSENDGLPKLETKVNSEFIKELKNKLAVKQVEVALPKFKITYMKSMKPYFKTLGLKNIFNPGADFSGISDSKELFISEIFHTAVLEVNEEGTVAAAATAVMMGRRAAIRSNPTFIADHPFMFLIYNAKTDLILFMGRAEEIVRSK